jgi:hypothetical protein
MARQNSRFPWPEKPVPGGLALWAQGARADVEISEVFILPHPRESAWDEAAWLSFARNSLKNYRTVVGLIELEADEPEKVVVGADEAENVVVEGFGWLVATAVVRGPLKPPPPEMLPPPVAPPPVPPPPAPPPPPPPTLAVLVPVLIEASAAGKIEPS